MDYILDLGFSFKTKIPTFFEMAINNIFVCAENDQISWYLLHSHNESHKLVALNQSHVFSSFKSLKVHLIWLLKITTNFAKGFYFKFYENSYQHFFVTIIHSIFTLFRKFYWESNNTIRQMKNSRFSTKWICIFRKNLTFKTICEVLKHKN